MSNRSEYVGCKYEKIAKSSQLQVVDPFSEILVQSGARYRVYCQEKHWDNKKIF